MLKAYAVALVLTTSSPVTDKSQEGLQKAEQTKPVVTHRDKPRSGIGF
jgi:hypothetical protein